MKGMNQQEVEKLKNEMHGSALAVRRIEKSVRLREEKIEAAKERDDQEEVHRLQLELGELQDRLHRDKKDLAEQREMLRTSWTEGG